MGKECRTEIKYRSRGRGCGVLLEGDIYMPYTPNMTSLRWHVGCLAYKRDWIRGEGSDWGGERVLLIFQLLLSDKLPLYQPPTTKIKKIAT